MRPNSLHGGFSLVAHPIPPRTLAAPLHRHAHEDEYSYVLEGQLGALLGADVVFAEMAADSEAMSGDAVEAIDVRYGLEVDYESIPRLCEEHGLWFPE